jgi:hypothetical protein
VSADGSLPPDRRVDRFHAAFWSRVSPALRRLSWVGTLAAVVLGALLARNGTPGSRLAAAIWLLLVAGSIACLYVRRGRQKDHVARILSQIVRPSDPVASRRSLRALRLLAQTQEVTCSASTALAERYVQNSLERISTDAIERRARRHARLMDTGVIVALLATLVLVSKAGHRVLEGLDVALARSGSAPIAMPWLDVTGVSVQPPAYLRLAEHSILFGSRLSEPTGSLISVRGLPLQAGRELVLTNGQQSVEFTETAEGEVVAHWTLLQSGRLKIAARFGSILIEQDDSILIDAEPDDPPEVNLENEGQTVQLGHTPRVELKYQAFDDHGLRQIEVVLKAADREERRTLMRLDGQQREQGGAYALRAGDPFLKEVHLPTLVRVEARDDNNLVASNWGHSGWLKLEPTMPGQPEAERIEELQRVRTRLVEWLAAYRMAGRKTGDEDHLLAEHRERVLTTLTQTLATQHDQWNWPSHVELLGRALLEKLARLPVKGGLAQPQLEQATLALDSLVFDLAQRDARAVCGALAELADEAALGARQANSTEFRDRGDRRVNDALLMLGGGGRSLAVLGPLGADLASIVRATLLRIERAREAHDYTHVQLAAEYLATRLRRPEPSAGSLSTSGVESAPGDARPRPSASNAHQRIERLLLELEQLRQEHRSGLELLERTLKTAEADASQDASSTESRDRAAHLRQIAEGLPNFGAEPDSAQSSQVVAREQALGAAEAMLHQRSGDALDRVHIARDAISEAMLRAAREGTVGGIDQETLRKLDEELASQARSLEHTEQRTQAQIGRMAAQQLREQVGTERQLALRARSLAQREQRGDTVIPEILRHDLGRAAALMERASGELERSDGTQALDHEKAAQALIDHFEAQPSNRSTDGARDDAQGKNSPATNQGTVTPTGDPELAARFRARVQKGLSPGASGELGSAVRRYAEGLLR